MTAANVPAEAGLRGVGIVPRHPLTSVIAVLARANDVDEILDVLLYDAVDALGAGGGCVATLSDDGQQIEVLRASGFDEEIARSVRRIPLTARYPLSDVARTGAPRWYESKQKLFASNPALADLMEAHPRNAWVVMPLAADDVTLGVVSIGFSDERQFSETERSMMATLAACAAHALQRAWARERQDDRHGMLTAAFRQLPCGVVIADAAGRLVASNDEAARILGPDLRPLLPGQSDAGRSAFRGFSADGRPLGEQDWPLARALATQDHVAHETIEIRRADGTSRWIDASAAPLRNASGRATAAVFTFSDVTDRARADAEQHSARDLAERTVAKLSNEIAITERLVSMLSHDLRTPLAAITLSAHWLARSVLAVEERVAANRIVLSAGRMQRLIEQVLDWARMRHGGMPINVTEVDLHALVCEQIDEIKTAFPRAEIRLRLEGDRHGCWDGDRLAEVVTNLVANAVQHGVGDAIDVWVHGGAQWVTLEVRNQGPPIASDVLPTIFDPFRRGPGARYGSGCGLGLYITREIVAAHGGSIVASSGPDGTSFVVRLPRAERTR